MSRFAKLLNSTHLIQQNTEMQNTITWKAVHVTYLLSLELQANVYESDINFC